MSSNAELIQLVTNYVKTGNRDTTAANLRTLLNAMIASYQNLDDKNIANGYPSLNSNAKLNPDLLSQTSQTGKFLSDSGAFIDKSIVFTSSDNEAILKTYSAFVFTGGTPRTWTSFVVGGNWMGTIVNRSSQTLRFDYVGGTSKIYDLAAGSTVNTINILTNTQVTIIDDGTFLIIF